VKRIDAIGGVHTMFLTHRDDVADHARFAKRFGCERVMHADDGAHRLGIEQVLRGDEPAELDKDLIAIPVPGHTPDMRCCCIATSSCSRRSSGLVTYSPDTDRVSKRLLVFMGSANALDGETAQL